MTHVPRASSAALRRLLRLARELFQVPDLSTVQELAGPAIQELLVADAALLLVAPGDEEFVTEFDSTGCIQPPRKQSTLYKYARQALDDRTPILLPRTAADPDREASLGSELRSTSLCAFPFPPIRPIGVLAVLWYRKERQHQLTKHVATLRYLGELIGAALSNVAVRRALEARVLGGKEEMAQAAREHAIELQRRDLKEQELHRIAVTDAMTGMLNRRGFFLHAERSFKLARRQGVGSVLIFADLDGVKDVNDRLGHEAGDHLIQDGAQILERSFRESDVVARIGGDEFAAFTLAISDPQSILARIEENIEALHRRCSPPYRISFSTGVVECDPTTELTLPDYLALADRRMYTQKKPRR